MVDAAKQPRFQILALSGGGFRGLYTAKILAEWERHSGEPIARHFDLISGTSVGGILALAISMEIPASRIVDMFVNHGEAMFKRRFSLNGLIRAPYSSAPLRGLLSADNLFGERLVGQCKHPVIVPSINYSTGEPVLFKTPHHPNFKSDHLHTLVDVALATSAAPAYFPRHSFNHNQYVDGGLYANAPGLLALHEATTFFRQSQSQVHLLSVGTMSSKFTVDPRKNREGGTYDWGGLNPANTPRRLFGLSISVQESLARKMLQHSLHDQFLHVDDDLTDQRAGAVALDKADPAAQEVLLGSAIERAKITTGDPNWQAFFRYTPGRPVFYYGENRNC